MSLSILQDARLYEVLHRLDVDLAQMARASGCRHCDGVLHSAHYRRKPRGGPLVRISPMVSARFAPS